MLSLKQENLTSWGAGSYSPSVLLLYVLATLMWLEEGACSSSVGITKIAYADTQWGEDTLFGIWSRWFFSMSTQGFRTRKSAVLSFHCFLKSHVTKAALKLGWIATDDH